MATKEEIYGCTVVWPEETPAGWICFDSKVFGIAADAADDAYNEILSIAQNIRLHSGNKYSVDLRQISDGIIPLTNNLAVESDYDFRTEVVKIAHVINGTYVPFMQRD